MSRRNKRQNSDGNPAAPRRLPKILYTIAAIVSIIGLCEAIYLTVAHITGETLACGGSNACSEVLGSKYASIGPVPLALVGAIGYFTAFSCAIFAAFGYARAAALFLIAVAAMFLTTLALLYLQAFVIHSFCRYCLFSAALVFVLAAIAILVPLPPRRA